MNPKSWQDLKNLLPSGSIALKTGTIVSWRSLHGLRNTPRNHCLRAQFAEPSANASSSSVKAAITDYDSEKHCIFWTDKERDHPACNQCFLIYGGALVPMDLQIWKGPICRKAYRTNAPIQMMYSMQRTIRSASN